MRVFHKLDPLKQAGTVIERFRWLGRGKLIVEMPDGTFSRDWENEWINEDW